MKRFIIMAIVTLTVVSCKKTVEKIQENYMLNLMTKGQWVVTKFEEGSTDVTTDFAAYSFQFYENGTVSGLSAGPENKGTWVADIANRSITANFPNADVTIQKLNANWKIIDSSTDEVKATTTINNILKTLWLRKK